MRYWRAVSKSNVIKKGLNTQSFIEFPQIKRMNSSSETLHWGNPIYFRAYVHIGKFSKKKNFCCVPHKWLSCLILCMPNSIYWSIYSWRVGNAHSTYLSLWNTVYYLTDASHLLLVERESRGGKGRIKGRMQRRRGNRRKLFWEEFLVHPFARGPYCLEYWCFLSLFYYLVGPLLSICSSFPLSFFFHFYPPDFTFYFWQVNLSSLEQRKLSSLCSPWAYGQTKKHSRKLLFSH